MSTPIRNSAPLSNANTAQAAPRSNPSSALLGAALVGLLGSSLLGCDSDNSTDEESKEDAGKPTQWDAGSDDEEDAKADEQDAASNKDNDADTGTKADGGAQTDAGAQADASAGPEILSEVEGTIAFSKLKSDCDSRGGYMQVHASCAGSNDCAGFTYFDGEPGTLTEHTCAAANGCAGASCVVLPKDSGKTPDQILYAEELPFGGPQPCWFCHAESEKVDGKYVPDKTKFKVWVPAGSTRNATNWLDLSAAEQEHIIAFGRVSAITVGGQQVTQRSMKGYHQLYSRAEIERVVAALRKLTPVIKEITAPK